jgi:hypothetical protein
MQGQPPFVRLSPWGALPEALSVVVAVDVLRVLTAESLIDAKPKLPNGCRLTRFRKFLTWANLLRYTVPQTASQWQG